MINWLIPWTFVGVISLIFFNSIFGLILRPVYNRYAAEADREKIAFTGTMGMNFINKITSIKLQRNMGFKLLSMLIFYRISISVMMISLPICLAAFLIWINL